MKRILVGDDLAREQKSEPTPVLRLAAELAEAFSAEIHLVHTYRVPALSVPTESMTLIEMPFVDEMKKSLEEEARVLQRKKPNLTIVPSIEKGEPVETLLNDVTLHDCQLIVLGTHARHGIRRALLGSVSEEVMRRATVPVLTVNPHTEIRPGYRPTKILVPVNILLKPDPAIALAAEFARKFHAALLLVHVIEEWVYPLVQSASLLAGGVVLPLERDLRELGNLRYTQLQSIVQPLLEQGLAVSGKLVERATSVSEGILNEAREGMCDLIVLSHRNLGRVEYALEGSVSRTIAREAHVPVLSVGTSVTEYVTGYNGEFVEEAS